MSLLSVNAVSFPFSFEGWSDRLLHVLEKRHRWLQEWREVLSVLLLLCRPLKCPPFFSKPTKLWAVFDSVLFPWQQEQPDSIHLGSEELRWGIKPATKVRLLWKCLWTMHKNVFFSSSMTCLQLSDMPAETDWIFWIFPTWCQSGSSDLPAEFDRRTQRFLKAGSKWLTLMSSDINDLRSRSLFPMTLSRKMRNSLLCLHTQHHSSWSSEPSRLSWKVQL